MLNLGGCCVPSWEALGTLPSKIVSTQETPAEPGAKGANPQTACYPRASFTCTEGLCYFPLAVQGTTGTWAAGP